MSPGVTSSPLTHFQISLPLLTSSTSVLNSNDDFAADRHSGSWHTEEQQSQPTRFPSSQVSPGSMVPLPQSLVPPSGRYRTNANAGLSRGKLTTRSWPAATSFPSGCTARSDTDD